MTDDASPVGSESATPHIPEIKPRLAAVRLSEASAGSRRYALACAAISAAAQVLTAAHTLAGVPGAGTGDADEGLRRVVARARTAAGAMSGVGGRLLTLVREDEADLIEGLPDPVIHETGVTTPGLLIDNERRMTCRALAAAHAECAAAMRDAVGCAAPVELTGPLSVLTDVAEQLRVIVEDGRRSDPDPSGSSSSRR